MKNFFLSPGCMLTLFIIISICFYFDRGTFSACQEAIKKDFALSEYLYGLAHASMVFGFCLSGPFFARLSHTISPIRLTSYGMMFFCLVCVALGFVETFPLLVLMRILAGIGEASFLCVIPPVIDDIAPPHRRSIWLSFFYASIPVGYAFGFIIPGKFVHWNPFGEHWSWRAVYFGIAAVLFPVALFTTLMPYTRALNERRKVKPIDSDEKPSKLSDSDESVEESDGIKRVIKKIGILAVNPIFIFNMLMYTFQTFVAGAYQAFCPGYLVKVFGFDNERGTTALGIITLFCGTLGTFFGGWIVDHLKKARGVTTERESTVISAEIVAVCAFFTIPSAYLAIMMTDGYSYLFFFFVAEMFVLITIAPLNSITMWSVPAKYRAFALSVTTITLHMLGDVISPPIYGFLLDMTESHERTMLIITSPFVLSFIFSILTLWYAKRAISENGKIKAGEVISCVPMAPALS
eukprot:89186_1